MKEIQKETKEKAITSAKGIMLTKKKRMMIFLILTAVNILLNMDHGTIPAASVEIKNDLNINDTTLGTFGSLVYFGNLIGALFVTKMIDIFDRKVLSIATTIINALFLFLFTKVTSRPFLFFIRVVVGIMQSFITIYFPVWIDQYGPRKWKTMMLSVFNITSPLGVVLGYILTMLIKDSFDVSLIKFTIITVESFLYCSNCFAHGRIFSLCTI